MRTASAVFPTHVGMFLCEEYDAFIGICFPHACGDVPGQTMNFVDELLFSPRMWGCSVVAIAADISSDVFPTHVGMFRKYQ